MDDLIGGTKIAGMPVNGRSYTDLLALQPGVMPVSTKQPNAVVMSGAAVNGNIGSPGFGQLVILTSPRVVQVR